MANVIRSLPELTEKAAALGIAFPARQDISVLGEKVCIGGKTAKNRLVCQAMEGCNGTSRGLPNELTYRRYRRLAAGGAGIIWFEATAVLPEARANPRQLYVNENNLDAFRRLAEDIRETALRETGSTPLIIMQLTHSGRYSKPEGTPAPLIAYHNPLFETERFLPDDCVVSDDSLDRVGEALVQGAALAEKAGFDGADIKCCHRYLNCELLSAFTRPGKYGGSFENRTRLLRESVLGAMQTCGADFLVTTRLNVYDGFPFPYGFGVNEAGGLAFDKTEPALLLKTLAGMGMPLANITMGNPYVNPHVNRPFAKGPYEAPEDPLLGVHRMLEGTAELKKETGNMKLICSALSYLGPAAPQTAAGYIADGGFDFAGFGRTVFAYPDFAKDILQNGGMAQEKCCICCSKCSEIMRAGGTPGCVIRDKETYLPIYNAYCGRK